MKRYIILFLNSIILSYCFQCVARELPVLQYHYAGPVVISKPYLSDSADVNGKQLNEVNLLHTTFSASQMLNSATVESVDSANTCFFDAPRHQYSLSVFRFYLTADQFVKGKLEVSATGLFEIYVNGKKCKEKTQVDTFLFVTTELNLEPYRYEVVIKYLSTPDYHYLPSIKCLYKTTDTLAEINITTNPEMTYFVNNLQDGTFFSKSSISANGKYALVSLRETKDGESDYYTLLMETESGKILLHEDGYLNNASWMPTSNAYYYTRKGFNGKELIVVNPEDFQVVRKISSLPEGSFYWTPDEKKLIFMIKEEGPKEQGALMRLLSPGDRQKGWRERYQLACYDTETGVLESLTFGYRNAWLADISSDSRYLLFSTSTSDYTHRPFSTTSIYRMEIATHVVDTILYNAPYIGSATFSPDGKQLLITGCPEAFDGIGLNIGKEKIANSYDTQLFIYDLSTQKATPLTQDFDPAINYAFWSPQDNLIYTLVSEKDEKAIYSLNIDKLKYTKCQIPEEVLKSFSASTEGKGLICFGQSASNADRLYFYQPKNGSSQLLMDLSSDKLKDVVLGAVKDWNYLSEDGTTIYGRYYLPPHFDSTKVYPLLVYYYGGTSPTLRNLEFSYSMHLFAAQGYVVYTLNPSGTTGFGQEFSARHVNAWGKRTADEIIAATSLFCKEHHFIDASKIGCFGASYGGFMTQYLQTQTDMFAAAISHAGISSISSYWGEGYWGIGYCSIANADSYPWNNSELFVEQSPLFHADKINTPLLLLHGNSDTNVPIGESIQLYNALTILGKTVEFIQIDKENHGVSNYHNKALWTKTMMAWFAKWLKNQPNWWDELYPDRNL